MSARNGGPRTGEIYLDNRNGGARALASVELGGGGQFQIFVLDPDGSATASARPCRTGWARRPTG